MNHEKATYSFTANSIFYLNPTTGAMKTINADTAHFDYATEMSKQDINQALDSLFDNIEGITINQGIIKDDYESYHVFKEYLVYNGHEVIHVDDYVMALTGTKSEQELLKNYEGYLTKQHGRLIIARKPNAQDCPNRSDSTDIEGIVENQQITKNNRAVCISCTNALKGLMNICQESGYKPKQKYTSHGIDNDSQTKALNIIWSKNKTNLQPINA